MKKQTWRTALTWMLALTLALGMWGGMPAGIVAADGIDFPLLEENFDYGTTAGNLTSVTVNWTVHSGTANPVQYIITSLAMDTYGSTGIGGAMTVNAARTGEDVNRVFANQTAGVIYHAALVNVITATVTGDYFLHLMPVPPSISFYGRVFAKDDGSGNLLFGVARQSEAAVYSTDTFAYNTTYLVVVKVDQGTGVTNLYALTAYTDTEPATSNATASGTGAIANIGAVAFRQGTAANMPVVIVDGIRVAKDWNTVVGQGTVTSSGLIVDTPYYFGDTRVAMELNSGDPGTVSVTKHRVAPGGNPPDVDAEMPLQWNITATGDTFDLDLMLCYNDEELDGLTEANVLAYRWDTGTSTWGTGMGAVNTISNCVTIPGVTAFSKWSLGVSQPTAVTYAGLQSGAALWAPVSLLFLGGAALVLRKRR